MQQLKAAPMQKCDFNKVALMDKIHFHFYYYYVYIFWFIDKIFCQWRLGETHDDVN